MESRGAPLKLHVRPNAEKMTTKVLGDQIRLLRGSPKLDGTRMVDGCDDANGVRTFRGQDVCVGETSGIVGVTSVAETSCPRNVRTPCVLYR